MNNRLAEKERYFREFGVWPVVPEFDTNRWLENFLSNELSVAERLLTNFSFFNERMTDALLCASIQNYFSIEMSGINGDSSIPDINLGKTVFVTSEGERPHPTDSGNLFARKLRNKICIPEENIKSPENALADRNKFNRFIFIDDFSGSGNQFEETWKRKHETPDGNICFRDISQADSFRFAFCCCISTWKAKNKIERVAPSVTLSSAHLIPQNLCAVNPESKIWEGMEIESSLNILRNASDRAGYNLEDGSQNDWRGFHSLGLTLAFNHGIPDASLPIFHSSRENWKPLFRRN